MYTKAYSPVWEEFVSIEEIVEDDNGRAVIRARIGDSDSVAFFRQEELIDWCV